MSRPLHLPVTPRELDLILESRELVCSNYTGGKGAPLARGGKRPEKPSRTCDGTAGRGSIVSVVYWADRQQRIHRLVATVAFVHDVYPEVVRDFLPFVASLCAGSADEERASAWVAEHVEANGAKTMIGPVRIMIRSLASSSSGKVASLEVDLAPARGERHAPAAYGDTSRAPP